MPLVEGGRIVEDRYVHVADDAPIPDRVPVIVPAKRFLADAAELVRRDGSLGVAWPNDRRVAELEPWLGHLALIALEFPKFRDGRAYSQARLLREQYGFRGTLRATGDVLRDQFHFLVRAGFDSFEVKKPADARGVRAKCWRATASTISRAPTAARRRCGGACKATPPRRRPAKRYRLPSFGRRLARKPGTIRSAIAYGFRVRLRALE